MSLRLRQICLVAADLDRAERELTEVLGLEVCYRDPGVGRFGLHNFLLPIGDQFLEVVAPLREGTAAGRYLERRAGDGGYMVILQCGDVQAYHERMHRLGVRLVIDGTERGGDSIGIQLHPKDVPAAMVELRWNAGADEPLPPWEPAGHDWQKARRTDVVDAIRAAELQADDPTSLAARWADVLDRPTAADGTARVIALDDATLRFVPAVDGRGEGLGGLDLHANDPERALRAAEARGCRLDGDTILLCGTRFRLTR
jgi:catechol 2,3-dioxygenase-like lactoylglutathione lyase family enzyme